MHIFISYRRSEQSFAERLRDALQAWGHTTWIDIDNIPKGAYWPDEIDKGLEAADVIVGVMSPDAITSRNVKNEWDWAISNAERGKRFLLLLLQPCTIPHRYVSINYIDATKNHVNALAQLKNALADTTRPLYNEVASGETPTPKSATTTPNDNRARMLTKVRENWIHGVLDKALQDSEFQLGMTLKPDAVLKHVDYGDYALPNTAGILNVFDDLGRELLILGAPGAGKTVLMLQLAEKLIDRAQADTTKPIPVVINLASWAEKQPPLYDWLVERLFLEYQVPRKVGKRWLDNEQLLPLFDGLDEVKEDARSQCVDAINTFRQTYRNVDMVVCSRIADYEPLTSKLSLQGAITLQPLTVEDVNKHLEGDDFTALRSVMDNAPELQEMASLPFLLNTMSFTYRGATKGGVTAFEGETAWRKDLFEKTIHKRFQQQSRETYSFAQSNRWLSWLAYNMVKEKQSVFYIEGLQPNWLATNQWRLYMAGYRLLIVILAGLLLGLYIGRVWLVTGLVAGLVEVVCLLPIVLLGALLAEPQSKMNDNIEVAETLNWSLHPGDFVVLWTRLLFPLSVAFVFGFVGGPLGWLLIGLAIGLAYGLKRSETVSNRIMPNQGIFYSAYNALRLGISLGLLFSLAVGLAEGLAVALTYGLTLGGGNAVFQHIVLRSIISRSGVAPLNYAHFLDFCADIGILRKVGGGYIFQHRLLLEYFASLHTND